jgi:hypothetical protein
VKSVAKNSKQVKAKDANHWKEGGRVADACGARVET